MTLAIEEQVAFAIVAGDLFVSRSMARHADGPLPRRGNFRRLREAKIDATRFAATMTPQAKSVRQ